MMNTTQWRQGAFPWICKVFMMICCTLVVIGSVVGVVKAEQFVAATVQVFREDPKFDIEVISHKPTVLVVVYGKAEGIEQAIQQTVANFADFCLHSGIESLPETEGTLPEIPEYFVEYVTDDSRNVDIGMLGELLFSLAETGEFLRIDPVTIPLSSIISHDDWIIDFTLTETFGAPTFAAGQSDSKKPTVPEPSLLLLILIGLFGMVGIKYVRRRKYLT